MWLTDINFLVENRQGLPCMTGLIGANAPEGRKIALAFCPNE
jgi:hypothetical protein